MPRFVRTFCIVAGFVSKNLFVKNYNTVANQESGKKIHLETRLFSANTMSKSAFQNMKMISTSMITNGNGAISWRFYGTFIIASFSII